MFVELWGYIFLETYTNTNYSFSFPSDNAQIILQLIHWQYWWWFWFTYFIVLYYLLFIRLLHINVLKFSPKLVTSYRAHGKWGDLLVCFIPVSWCLNILTNSNFILRMLEWQMETSLLTLRVRGKQWYWIYKFELSNLLMLYNNKKMIGLNEWVYDTNINSHHVFLYLDLMQLRHNSKFLDFYWDSIFLNNLNNWTNTHLNLPNFLTYIGSNDSSLQLDFFSGEWLLKNYPLHLNLSHHPQISSFIISSFVFSGKSLIVEDSYIYSYVDKETDEIIEETMLVFGLAKSTFRQSTDTSFVWDTLWAALNIFNWAPTLSVFCDEDNKSAFSLLNEDLVYDMSVFSAFFQTSFYNSEINRLFKSSDIITSLVLDLSQPFTNQLNFFKFSPHSYSHLYWVLKQKRNIFKKQVLNLNNLSAYQTMSGSNSTSYILNERILPFTQQIMSRRLLRTNRILLLPIQINLTVITNSFDVIHSWYIPGLGIKLDCVPGRSTHHNLNIQSAGFYYGQCAEICGRYHHHMPIRICAVSFHHFLLWWSHFGLNKFLLPNNITKKDTTFLF